MPDITSIPFRFKKADKPSDPKADPKEFRESLSALVFAGEGKVAFLGGDENVEAEPSIERLVRQADGSYGAHESLKVSSYLSLPDTDVEDGRMGEIDIEGLALDDGWLWVTGSFSCNRKKPGKKTAEQLERLAQVRLGKNRFFLGRIPLDDAAEGGPTLAKKLGDRKAGRVASMEAGGEFIKALEADEHLGPSLQTFKNDKGKNVRMPGKDNGLDIEGLLVFGSHVFLGLRGPVLRGYACLLELEVISKQDGSGLELAPLSAGDAGQTSRLYRKHFLKIDGLGIRDLQEAGDDLLILAGPTGDVHGPTLVYTWKNWRKEAKDRDTLTELKPADGNLPVELRSDAEVGHPEALTLLPGQGGAKRKVLVMRDSPGEAASGEKFSAFGEVVTLPK